MSKSDDDVDGFRRNRRREQNRRAARRSRQRRKDLAAKLLKEYQELQSANTQLLYDARMLDKERQTLDDCLSKHIASCQKSSVIFDPLSSSTTSHGEPSQCLNATRSTSELPLVVNNLTPESAIGCTFDRSDTSEVLNRPSSSGNNSTGNSNS